MNNKQLSIFFEKLKQFVEVKELIKLVLSNKRDEFSDLKSIIATIVKPCSAKSPDIVVAKQRSLTAQNTAFKNCTSKARVQ